MSVNGKTRLSIFPLESQCRHAFLFLLRLDVMMRPRLFSSLNIKRRPLKPTSVFPLLKKYYIAGEVEKIMKTLRVNADSAPPIIVNNLGVFQVGNHT